MLLMAENMFLYPNSYIFYDMTLLRKVAAMVFTQADL